MRAWRCLGVLSWETTRAETRLKISVFTTGFSAKVRTKHRTHSTNTVNRVVGRFRARLWYLTTCPSGLESLGPHRWNRIKSIHTAAVRVILYTYTPVYASLHMHMYACTQTIYNYRCSLYCHLGIIYADYICTCGFFGLDYNAFITGFH